MQYELTSLSIVKPRGCSFICTDEKRIAWINKTLESEQDVKRNRVDKECPFGTPRPIL